jgi:hypothetical protein
MASSRMTRHGLGADERYFKDHELERPPQADLCLYEFVHGAQVVHGDKNTQDGQQRQQKIGDRFPNDIAVDQVHGAFAPAVVSVIVAFSVASI